MYKVGDKIHMFNTKCTLRSLFVDILELKKAIDISKRFKLFPGTCVPTGECVIAYGLVGDKLVEYHCEILFT